MSVQSLSFLAFLLAALAVCLAAGRKSAALGRAALTCFGAVFCLLGSHGAASFAVLAAGCAVTALTLRAFRGGRRRWALLLGCGYHIGVLAIFKYVVGGVSPLGLSFFTFQQLWLLKDVYTGAYTLRPGDSLGLYAFFFPVMTSGPILRPGALFPQIAGERFLRPDSRDAAAGCYAIAVGMGKKVLLADAFGVVVNNGWAQTAALSAPAAWLVMLGYTFQLYFDFSGYCDIVSGCARLLGISLPVNFRSPYRSCSVTEFWKRWHITLTDFLRECVYFPLGGSRRGTVRTCVNILAVFLISGVWHGTGWTFLVWGALHGLAQITERLWGAGRSRLPALLRWTLTFAFLNVAWVFFRAPDLAAAGELLSAAVSGGLAKPEAWLLSGLFGKEIGAVTLLIPGLKPWANVMRLVVLYGVGALAAFWPRNTVDRMDSFRPTLWRALALGVLLVWSVLSFTGVTTFIYANF